jgi:hypothetical protein
MIIVNQMRAICMKLGEKFSSFSHIFLPIERAKKGDLGMSAQIAPFR